MEHSLHKLLLYFDLERRLVLLAALFLLLQGGTEAVRLALGALDFCFLQGCFSLKFRLFSF